MSKLKKKRKKRKTDRHAYIESNVSMYLITDYIVFNIMAWVEWSQDESNGEQQYSVPRQRQ